jgi:hypothetical protein
MTTAKLTVVLVIGIGIGIGIGMGWVLVYAMPAARWSRRMLAVVSARESLAAERSG